SYLATAGTQSITATDNGNVFSVSRSGIIVTAATATSVSVSGYPLATTAGATHAFQITARDAFGNIATGFTSTVTLGGSDAQASFAGSTYALTAADAGLHSFNGFFKTAGTQSLAVVAPGLGHLNQTGIVVSAASATSLTLSGLPAATTAGVAH